MATIAEILARHRLARRLDTSLILDQNHWFMAFEIEARALCSNVLSPEHIDFCFIEDPDIQACAIELPSNLVVMYSGMFWMLCRLSSVVVTNRMMPAMGGVADPVWKPKVERSSKTTRSLLGQGPYDWTIESAEWRHDAERTGLFYILLNTMFRFVVLHEIGHIASNHQLRRALLGGKDTIIVDAFKPPLLPASEAIPSQAREVVADCSAFMRLINILDRELEFKKDLELTHIFREKLIQNKRGLIVFVLTALYLYFRMSDRDDWWYVKLDTLSHPPAPFRLKAICASLIEHHHLGVSEEDAGSIVREALFGGEAIMSVALDCYPRLDWLELVDTPESDGHFNRLYEECPSWAGKLST